MSHVFISHSHKDKAYVDELDAKFREFYLDAWVDDRIPYGAVWPREIEEKVNSCDAFVLVMTPNSYKSNWVQSELAHAQQKGKPIFPLLLEGDRWIPVQSIQCVDVRDGSLPPDNFFYVVACAIAEEKIKRGEKFPEIVILPRVQDGRRVVELVSGAHAYIKNHDEPANEQEMHLIKDFLQDIEDLDVVSDVAGSSFLVETAFRLSEQIRELETYGLYIYADRLRRTVKFGQLAIENASVIVVVVARRRNEFLPLIFPLDE